MTEPIIINDTDISGCHFYTKYCCINCKIFGTCGNNPDCYYKQLQREKQKVAVSSHEHLAKMLVNDLYNDLNQILAKVKEVLDAN